MMSKVIILALLATVASAFIGSKVVARTANTLSMKLDIPGSTLPLGFFDPLGFTKGASPATIQKYRESELKHGRVAMLATFGILTSEKFHPLYDGKLSGNPLTALAEAPPLAFVQIFAFCGLLEYTFLSAAKAENYRAGDYYGVSNRIADVNDPAWVGFQNRELNNGRLAMFAVLGQLANAAITGKGPLEYWNL